MLKLSTNPRAYLTCIECGYEAPLGGDFRCPRCASLLDVNRPGWRPAWERDRLGGKLVMRLHKGDMVEIDDGPERCVKVVHQIEISAGRLRLAPHYDAGKLQDRHEDPDDPFRWDLASISKLKARGCVALRVNPMGVRMSARTNVG